MSKTKGEMVKRNRRSEEDKREMESECVRIHSNLTFKGKCLWNGTLRTKIEKEITNKVRKNGLTKTTSCLPLISCSPPPPHPPFVIQMQDQKRDKNTAVYLHLYVWLSPFLNTSHLYADNLDFQELKQISSMQQAVLYAVVLFWFCDTWFEGLDGHLKGAGKRKSRKYVTHVINYRTRSILQHHTLKHYLVASVITVGGLQ